MPPKKCDTSALFPYKDYFVAEPTYDSFNRRRVIYIIHKETRKRIHLSYARYLMETHLKRKLERNEFVHHKDGNQLNDCVENYEVMDIKAHGSHHNKIHQAQKFTCECGVEFELTFVQVGQRIRSSRSVGREMVGPYCSRSCVSKYARKAFNAS